VAAPAHDNIVYSGFTLIEFLVVTLLLSSVVGVSVALVSATTKVAARETASASVNEGLALGKHLILDDLSNAGYPGTVFNTGSTTPITALSPTFIAATVTTGTTADTVAFEGDVDPSIVGVERVCYQLSGAPPAALLRKVTSVGTPCGTTGFESLLTNIQAFTLIFLNSSRTALTASQVTASNATRYVDLKITQQVSAGAGSVSKTIYGEVAIRNY
jgi:Tfp pilus assembly protein PilW